MSAANVLKFIKEKEAEFVDLRFTDPRGKLQHLTMDSTIVDEDMLNEGVFFDGSSIAGWKAINESDMILKPDTSRMIMDPFTSHNTVVLFCDILDAVKKSPYERDPRGTAKKAEEYLKSSGCWEIKLSLVQSQNFLFLMMLELVTIQITLGLFLIVKKVLTTLGKFMKMETWVIDLQ
jgi:glutamine synthetase